MVSEDNRSTISSDERRTAADEPNSDVPNRGGLGLESRVERRSVLKLLGASTLPFVAGAGSATAADTGYGAGEYGAGGYGGAVDDGTDGSGGTDGSDGTDEPSRENTIRFDGVGTSGETHYEFTVTGSVEKSTDGGASINEGDAVDAGHVTGSLTGWRDAYRFSGELEALSVDGQATVSVNGEQVDPAEYGSGRSHVVTIVGNGTRSEYEITAGGSIEVIEGDATVVAEDRAEGSIERGVHKLSLSGDLLDVTFHEGGTHTYLDTELIDPADYTLEQRSLPHAIVIDGTDASDRTEYAFTIDGDVRKSEYGGATIDDTDAVDGGTVRGAVDAGAVDAYRFDGTIDDFRLAGEADVDLEYGA